MYNIDTIKRNGFDCKWATLFIGRQLRVISSVEVINFAVEFLEENTTVNNELILDLAWEQTEERVDELLERLISGSTQADMAKEYHKWLYSIVSEIYHNAAHENFFEEIEYVFQRFNSPKHMFDFFRKASDAYYYHSDSDHAIRELIEEFTEKQLIFKGKVCQ